MAKEIYRSNEVKSDFILCIDGVAYRDGLAIPNWRERGRERETLRERERERETDRTERLRHRCYGRDRERLRQRERL